jgi:hypothetical protein
MVKNSEGISFFHYHSRIHEDDMLSMLRHYAQIVADEEHPHIALMLLGAEQVHYLRLDSHIQCRSGLICDQDLRIACERHGNHGALAHST